MIANRVADMRGLFRVAKPPRTHHGEGFNPATPSLAHLGSNAGTATPVGFQVSPELGEEVDWVRPERRTFEPTHRPPRSTNRFPCQCTGETAHRTVGRQCNQNCVEIV